MMKLLIQAYNHSRADKYKHNSYIADFDHLKLYIN